MEIASLEYDGEFLCLASRGGLQNTTALMVLDLVSMEYRVLVAHYQPIRSTAHIASTI